MLSELFHKIFGAQATFEHLAQWVGWNSFLAAIPVMLAYLFQWQMSRLQGSGHVVRCLLAALVFGLWLAFVPNTCYLVTEWKHFLDTVVRTELYGGSEMGSAQFKICSQAVFFLFYSGIGVLCFVLAMRPIERVIRAQRMPFWPFAFLLFLLMSLGVYLGRSPYLRFNSWNVITQPGRVLAAILRIPHNPLVLSAVFVFALLLWGLYEALDIWVDGIADRWRQRQPSKTASPQRNGRSKGS